MKKYFILLTIMLPVMLKGSNELTEAQENLRHIESANSDIYWLRAAIEDKDRYYGHSRHKSGPLNPDLIYDVMSQPKRERRENYNNAITDENQRRSSDDIRFASTSILGARFEPKKKPL